MSILTIQLHRLEARIRAFLHRRRCDYCRGHTMAACPDEVSTCPQLSPPPSVCPSPSALCDRLPGDETSETDERPPTTAAPSAAAVAALRPVLAALDSALSPVHYAVSGEVALRLWGMPATSQSEPRSSVAVTIVCPIAARFVLATWADCAGLHFDRRRPAELFIPAAPEDSGRLLAVDVCWVDNDEFDAVLAASGAAFIVDNVPVLALPALLHLAARGYASGPRAAADPAARQRLVQGIAWLLRQMAGEDADTSAAIAYPAAEIPAYLDLCFYNVFPRAPPETTQLFAEVELALLGDSENSP